MNDELLEDFIVESYENLDRIDADLLALERGESNPALLASVFRSIHTIKGTCSFLGLSVLETLAHRGESLLSLLRDQKIEQSVEISNVLLQTVDAIRSILQRLEATESEGENIYGDIIEHLDYIVAHGHARPEAKAPSQPIELPIDAPPAADTPLSSSTPDDNEDETSDESQESSVSESSMSEEEEDDDDAFSKIVAKLSTESEDEDGESIQLLKPPTLRPVESADNEAPPPATSIAPKAVTDAINKSSLVDSTIRVDVGLLDRVMNLVGELVLARNRILQFAPQIEDPAFFQASQQLNLLTTELQGGIMKTRMQPIGNLWNKLPRLVRDLSRSCNKRVKLELEGVETELDRSIIEAIKDPLIHVVRNAIDHGIESPEEREAQQKNPEGTLLLRAYHESGQVNIEVTDDGGGLDHEKIKQKAIERGVVSPERALTLTDKDVSNMIFQAGFSTATKVTNVSGRGVGMDVVKTNIEKIGGTVDISSVQGSGTTLKVKIPLTLAIIPALTVTSNGERFAIPQINLLELVRLKSEESKAGIEHVFGSTMYRLRGHLLPLVFLDKCLGLRTAEMEERDPNEAISIVVLQADDRQFGVVVDSIQDTEEIVVKPLRKELKNISQFAGATIMGDGQVALILDVLGLVERASLTGSGPTHQLSDAGDHLGDTQENRESFLLFSVGGDSQMAIPLSMVTRIDKMSADQFEYAGDQLVVQCRGQILPLLDLRQGYGSRGDANGDQTVRVIVYSDGEGEAVGFVVESILDAVDVVIDTRRDSSKAGVLGTAVIQGRVTDLLDIKGVLRSSSIHRMPLKLAA